MALATFEPCPKELAHLDQPEYGGMLFFHQEFRLSGCPVCGWRGVPTIERGFVSTYCPVCSVDDTLPTPAEHVSSRNAPCPCGSGLKAKKCPCDRFYV